MKVALGTVLITPGALETFHLAEVAEALARHQKCDWGSLGATDQRANDEALQHGDRLLSAYGKRPLVVLVRAIPIHRANSTVDRRSSGTAAGASSFGLLPR